MASLAEIRARLQAAENKSSGQSSGGDNAIYPHWNIDEGTSATIRFLPDGDGSNTFFWVERAMIRLPFMSRTLTSKFETLTVRKSSIQKRLNFLVLILKLIAHNMVQ